MKSLTCLMLGLTLFSLVSCNPKDSEGKTEKSWSPVSCEAGTCATEWNFTFLRAKFPVNASIAVNGIILIDECNPINGQVVPTTEGDKLKFRKDNYAPLQKDQLISLRVMDQGDPCDTPDKEYIYHADQKFRVSEDQRDNFVMIDAF
jgi:hypothetical protein